MKRFDSPEVRLFVRDAIYNCAEIPHFLSREECESAAQAAITAMLEQNQESYEKRTDETVATLEARIANYEKPPTDSDIDELRYNMGGICPFKVCREAVQAFLDRRRTEGEKIHD